MSSTGKSPFAQRCSGRSKTPRVYHAASPRAIGGVPLGRATIASWASGHHLVGRRDMTPFDAPRRAWRKTNRHGRICRQRGIVYDTGVACAKHSRHMRGIRRVAQRRHGRAAKGDGAMRASPRPLLAAILACILALSLTGCMRVQRTLQINRDGSGAYTLTIGFREPTPGNAASLNNIVTDAMEAFAVHVEAKGGASRRFDDQGYAYWTFTRTFSSTKEGDDALQDDPRQFDTNATPILFHDSLRLTSASGPFGVTTFHVTGTISLVDILGNAQDWRDATESLTITMPGGISDHHGGIHDGDSITYTIGYNQSATVDVTGGAPAAGSATPRALAALLGVLALILAALGIRLLRSPARVSSRAA